MFRRNRRRKYKQSALLSPEIPPLGGIEMLVQGAGIVLGKHRHALNMGIGHIAQNKINAAVASGNGHGRNGPLVG